MPAIAPERLERLAEVGRLVRENADPLSRRIADSTRVPVTVAADDVLACSRVLGGYGTLLERLAAGAVDHPLWRGRRLDPSSRAPRGAVAAALPEEGAATAFALAVAPAATSGAPLEVHPAACSRSLFQTLESLLAEEGLRGACGFCRVATDERASFLSRHLDATSRTAVLQLPHQALDLPESLRQQVLRKRERFRLLVDGPAKNRFVVTAPLADAAGAAEALVDAALAGGGRARGRAEIFDVHESVLPQLLPLILARAEAAACGDPYDPATTVGPLPLERAQGLADQVRDALERGARLEFATAKAGKQPLVGPGPQPAFLLPRYRSSDSFAHFPVVVLSGVAEDAVLRAVPTRGPVIALRTFREDRQLIPGLLESPYGLAASLYGDEVEARHADLLQVLCEGHGSVFVNTPMYRGAAGPDPLLAPSGGFRRSTFTLFAGTVDGMPALIEIQAGPSFSFVDLTEPAGEPR